jgi:hypothetical protein
MTPRTPFPFPLFTGQVPERLFWDVKRGCCVLCVGAGLSSQVLRHGGQPLPGWGALLRELADLARNDGYPVTDDLLQTIHKGQLLEVGQELHQIIPISLLQRYLAGIFADSAIQPSPAHMLLPQMRLRAILTTNYDTLIEDAYLEATGTLPLTLTYGTYVSGQRDPIRNDDFFVYKIHGDYRDASSIALGTRGYQDLIHWNPGYRFLLESIFASYTMLFIGFGGSDPDINHVLDALAARFRSRPSTHYVLLPRRRWTETEKHRARDDRGLDLIEYDDADNHIQVGAFLRQLATGRPSRDGRLNIVVTVHRADEQAVSTLWPALGSSHYKVITLDLGRASQAGWFDDLRARIELCDVVILMISNSYGEHDLIEWVAKSAQRRIIPVLVGSARIPNSTSGGTSILATADEFWLELLLQRLEDIRVGIDLGG